MEQPFPLAPETLMKPSLYLCRDQGREGLESPEKHVYVLTVEYLHGCLFQSLPEDDKQLLINCLIQKQKSLLQE